MNFLLVVFNVTLHWAFQWSFKVSHLKRSLLWKNENYTMKHSAIITNIGGIKKERKKKRSALVTQYWDSQFRDKLWLLPLSGTEHNQQRIIKIPVVKNPQKCWMQKVFFSTLYVKDTGINYKFCSFSLVRVILKQKKKKRISVLWLEYRMYHEFWSFFFARARVLPTFSLNLTSISGFARCHQCHLQPQEYRTFGGCALF